MFFPVPRVARGMSVLGRLTAAVSKSEGRRLLFRGVENRGMHRALRQTDSYTEAVDQARRGEVSRREFLQKAGRRTAETQAKKPVMRGIRQGGAVTGLYKAANVKSVAAGLGVVEFFNWLRDDEVTAPSDFVLPAVRLAYLPVGMLSVLVEETSDRLLAVFS